VEAVRNAARYAIVEAVRNAARYAIVDAVRHAVVDAVVGRPGDAHDTVDRRHEAVGPRPCRSTPTRAG
jgi:hypothetical protein